MLCDSGVEKYQGAGSQSTAKTEERFKEKEEQKTNENVGEAPVARVSDDTLHKNLEPPVGNAVDGSEALRLK